MLIATGFEDSEAIVTYDLLSRAGFIMKTASIDNNQVITSSHKIPITTNLTLANAKLDEFDFIIIPGGKLGVDNIKNSTLAINAIKYFYEHKKGVFAICAAPSILGALGYLNNKRFTCFPGFEAGINGTYTGEPVTIVDEQIVTAKSMAYSMDFALAIIKKYMSEDVYQHVMKSTHGA